MQTVTSSADRDAEMYISSNIDVWVARLLALGLLWPFLSAVVPKELADHVLWYHSILPEELSQNHETCGLLRQLRGSRVS